LPLKVIVRIKGLGQAYEQIHKRNAGTYSVSTTLLARPSWCDAYAAMNPGVDPAVATIRAVVVAKKSGVGLIYRGRTAEALSVSLD
jgi:hypothetical protein